MTKRALFLLASAWQVLLEAMTFTLILAAAAGLAYAAASFLEALTLGA